MIKKIITISFLILIIIGSLSYGEVLPINIYINDDIVDFYDVKPFIDENGRTLVPVRLMSENFGASVQWLPKTREVLILKDDYEIILEIDSKYAKVNNNNYEMDTKALIINGRTLVPLRFVSEAFDFDIQYERGKDPTNNQLSHIINIYNIHLKIASELRNFNKDKFDVESYNLTLDKIPKLNNEMIDYFPELYFLNGFYYDYRNQQVMSLQLNYLEDSDALNTKYNQLIIKANEIIKSIISDDMTAYEKEKAIHDYLVMNIRYDEENQSPIESHTAYGALVNGVAVCDGYAESFDLLLKIVGIKSKLIYGTMDNVLHAWNLVEINGKKYFVDVTADDPTNNENNYMKYTYFNVPFDYMTISHVFDENYESVNSIEENYFYKNNLYFSTTKEVNNYIYNQLNQNQEDVRIRLMLSEDWIKERIDLENIITEFLNDNRDLYQANYAFTELDSSFKFIFDVVVKLNKK